MITNQSKSNQEEYSCQSNLKLTQRLFRTKTQQAIHPNQLFQDEISRNMWKELPPDFKKDKSNQIRTTLLLIIDSERATAMRSKCKINSKSLIEVLSQSESYEITIENPLERGMTLLNDKQFNSSKSESRPRKKIDNCKSLEDDDDDNGNNGNGNDYSRFVTKIKRKQTISMRKFKKKITTNNNHSIDSHERVNAVSPSAILNTKFDLIVQGCEYLRALALLYKQVKSSMKRNRAYSVKEKEINDFKENPISNKSKFTNDYKIRTPNLSSKIPPPSTTSSKKKKLIKYSSFNTQSNSLSNKFRTQQPKLTKDTKYSSGSVVILFNGEEIEINSIEEIPPELIEEGICLLKKSAKNKELAIK